MNHLNFLVALTPRARTPSLLLVILPITRDPSRRPAVARFVIVKLFSFTPLNCVVKIILKAGPAAVQLPRASSLKGSSPRPRNLQVSWSPDVRDPPHSSQSHSVGSHRNHRRGHNSKRHDKNSRKNSKASKSKKSGKGGSQKVISCAVVGVSAAAHQPQENIQPSNDVVEPVEDHDPRPPESVDNAEDDEGWCVVDRKHGRHKAKAENCSEQPPTERSAMLGR